MKHNSKADRYLKVVEWSDEDQCYIGSSPGLFAGGVHGNDARKVFDELNQVIGEWIKTIEDDGEELPPATAANYSGKFVLRVSPDLHKLLVIRSNQDGDSLNTYCAKVLTKAVVKKGKRKSVEVN